MPSNEKTFQDAIAALNVGRIDDAERLFKAFLKDQRNHVGALNLLVVALMSKNRFAEAEEYIARAVKLDPSSDVSHYNFGIISKRLRKPGQALSQFSNAIRLNAKIPETWNNRGTVFNDLKQFENAISDFDQAILLNQNYSDAYCNKGKSLSALARCDEAVAAYDKALALKPDLAEAWVGRCSVLTELKRYDEAFAACGKALALRPDLAEAWVGRGNILTEFNRHDEAVSAYDKAVALKPDLAGAWLGRGRCRCILGQLREGTDDYQKALQHGADEDSVRYQLAQFGVGETPIRMPNSVVKEVFDKYADRFEDELINKLKYQAPMELSKLIRSVTVSRPLDVLDLGCGTGLMGVQLRDIAGTLRGVDISARILKKAEQREIYDELTCSEITEFLAQERHKYDLVVATDVFIYFGDLALAFRQVSQILRDHGLFGFSVEATERDDFVLQKTGRYAHSAGYLKALAATYQFSIETIATSVIRQDYGKDVTGFIVLLRH
jgi:predicted TPR repeat methyltransferase